MTPLWLSALDMAAVFVFAVSGALLGGRARMDAFGMLVAAFVTGVGGGTLRDLLLDRPVFWLVDARYLAAAMAATALVWLFGARLERLSRPLSWADALGLAIAAPLGLAAARSVGAVWPVQIAMAVVTGTFGGLTRDLLCGARPMILHREIYATAVAAGAAVGVLADAAGAHPYVSGAACGASVFAVRAAAILRGWESPQWRGHAP
ncbi:trimeric intracellular cation channel family protein [Rubrimonas cliftonensis]|uniref:Uncharacterized membrane protein YeiH n=1 Tax=Rubrimonas cliftonensis TaxID=89524 RepID=A0A1H3YWB5_9RHOB|nr:TRIC cation channel family protein [Rubrimonas cliftonensis]SEA15855.1 Uncharacterized membrane protein YeiH [Rubrimonas cliftonensis]